MPSLSLSRCLALCMPVFGCFWPFSSPLSRGLSPLILCKWKSRSHQSHTAYPWDETFGDFCREREREREDEVCILFPSFSFSSSSSAPYVTGMRMGLKRSKEQGESARGREKEKEGERKNSPANLNIYIPSIHLHPVFQSSISNFKTWYTFFSSFFHPLSFSLWHLNLNLNILSACWYSRQLLVNPGSHFGHWKENVNENKFQTLFFTFQLSTLRLLQLTDAIDFSSSLSFFLLSFTRDVLCECNCPWLVYEVWLE